MQTMHPVMSYYLAKAHTQEIERQAMSSHGQARRSARRPRRGRRWAAR